MDFPSSGRLFTGLLRRVIDATSALDPRTGLVYRRSIVQGGIGSTGLQLFDRPAIEQVVDSCGYKPVEGEEDTFYHPWYRTRVTFAIDCAQSNEIDAATLREEIELPAGFSLLLVGAILTTFMWIYLPNAVGTGALLLASGVFATLLVGFVVFPSPLARYLDAVEASRETDEHRDTQDDTEGGVADSANHGSATGEAEQNTFPLEDDSLVTVLPGTYRTSCLGPPLTALLGGVVASGPVFITGIPLLVQQIVRSPFVSMSMFDTWFVLPLLGAGWLLSFWAFGFLAGLFIYSFEDEAARIRVFPFDLAARVTLPVPELSNGYLSLLLLSLLPMFSLSQSYFLLPAVYRLSPFRLWLYFLYPAVLMSATLPVFLQWWVVQNREYVFKRTIQRLGELDSSRDRAFVAFVAVGLSYLLAVTLESFLTKYWSYLGAPILNLNPLPVVEKSIFVLILLASVAPALYLLLGLVYQLFVHVVMISSIIYGSAPVGETPFRGFPVRVIEDPEPRAFALAMGPWRAVVISVGGYQSLSSTEELEAILAHEEAHLISGEKRLSDAQLSFLLPLIGCLTLTGKNILYALADYRSREEAADDYAVRVAGRDELRSALDAWGETDGTTTGSPFLPLLGVQIVAPYARPSSVLGAAERYFGLLFGSFALTRAHPSVSERKARLSRSEDDPVTER